MRNTLLTIGSVCAALAGVGYVAFVWGAIWNIVTVLSGVLWLAALAGGAVAVVLALTLLFRPNQPWLFPLCFSAATFLFSIVASSEPLVALSWAGFGLATFIVALGGTYLARYVSAKLQRT